MRRESTASAIATTSTSTTQHGIHNNNNLSSLVSATNASITNAKVGSSMVSSHPTPLILSDRFKRTLINVNHQYPKEIFRKFPAAMAAAIIETCDEEDGGGDGEGEDGSDADEDGLAESAAESTPVTKHAPFNRNQSKGSNNKTNNNNNNNTSKMTTVMDAAAREKLKVIASATQGQVQQSKTKQHSILQSRSPLPSILVRNGGGGGGDASATTQSISSSIGLAAIICTPNRADSHIATRSSYIKPISEKYEDGNNNNNNSNNNTTDSHHDEDGGGSGRGGGGDEGKGQGVNEDELVRYSPFNLQPKSSFNPST